VLRTYVVTALRALRRHLGYTVVNVGGLAVGIAACLLIGLYVRHEWSYDRFHEDAERIHRVVGDYGASVEPVAPWPAVRTLRQQNPSLTIAPFFEVDALVGRKTRHTNEKHVYVAKPAFFDVFTFPLRRGEATLGRPYTAVLTPDMAEKYFGDADPIGKSLEVTGLTRDSTLSVTVTGVLEPIPDASHFHPRLVVSWATLDAAFGFSEKQRNSWQGGAFRAYLKVPEGTPPSALGDRFTRQVQQRAEDQWSTDVSFWLQSITAIHLHSDFTLEIEPNGSAAYVYLFIGVGGIILLLAGVNFVNLALARSVERTREVGVRKAVGAGRGHIVRQFLAEAAVLAGGAAALALGLAAAALPLFRTLTGIPLARGVLVEPATLALLAGIAAVVALGSASYPAFVLSRFDPATVLGSASRGAARGGRQASGLRRGLIVFQFAAAVVLAAGTIAAAWQLDYLQAADLGFAKEQVVTVPMPPSATDGRPAFQRELEQQPGVQAVSRASASLPASLVRSAGFAFAEADRPKKDYHNLRFVTVGRDFFEALGAEPAAGRFFDPDRAADASTVVVNRAAADLLAQDLAPDAPMPEAALGRTLTSTVDWLVDQSRVVGVVEDVRLATLYESAEPVVFVPTSILHRTYYLRVDGAGAEPALTEAEEVWNEFFPDAPFAYEFADRAFASAYRADQRTGTLFGVFAALAFAIAGLGMFGLAAFAVRQRRREIGVRKAIGATAEQIVGLLSKDFVRLVAWAIGVAVPVAYVGIRWWLGTFARHIDLGGSVFLLASGGAIVVALTAVGLQAVRAARIDPAQVLRSE
jgi:putative ABC transport system permease protein